MALLADDPLGVAREDTGDLTSHLRGFDLVDRGPSHTLLAAVEGDSVAGTLQLTLLPGFSRGGSLRGQSEAVRVAAGARGRWLGEAMIGWAVDEARRQGTTLMQLTTDRRRHDARRFYERLGFVASHEGMKLPLQSPS